MKILIVQWTNLKLKNKYMFIYLGSLFMLSSRCWRVLVCWVKDP